MVRHAMAAGSFDFKDSLQVVGKWSIVWRCSGALVLFPLFEPHPGPTLQYQQHFPLRFVEHRRWKNRLRTDFLQNCCQSRVLDIYL